MALNVLLHQVPFEDQPMDCDFHPTRPLLATGLIDGKLLLHSYSRNGVTKCSSLKAHGASCRAVRFLQSGDLVITASTDQSLLAVDVETGKAKARKKEAHENAINRLAAAGPTLTASGDDSGVIKLWDSRQSDAVASLDAHEDFVSDLALHERESCLLSVSGDGTLAVTDLRTNKVRASSEGDADDELLSVVAIKHGKKLVCGSQSGVLDVWSWGFWNDCSDRFPGHPSSVDAILKYDEDSVLTGSSDGLIRLVSLQPNKMLGVIGEHADFPIERLALSSDRAFLASASHDNSVKLWDLRALEEGEDEEGEEGEEQEGVAAGGDSDEDGEADTDAEAGPETANLGAVPAVAAAVAPPEGDAVAAAAPAGLRKKVPKAAGKAAAAAGTGGSSDSSDAEDAPITKKRKKGAHRIPNKEQQKHRGGNFFAGLL
ncbi:hypothetical protein N2152v2_003342 [Parachlorella kessleri]